MVQRIEKFEDLRRRIKERHAEQGLMRVYGLAFLLSAFARKHYTKDPNRMLENTHANSL